VVQGTIADIHTYSEFFLRLAIGFYMLIFQPPVNFCSDENIQTIFGTKLEDFLNYRIDYNSISQTVEKVVKKIFLARRKRPEVEIVRCWLSRQEYITLCARKNGG
jgi:hypothetical protein